MFTTSFFYVIVVSFFVLNSYVCMSLLFFFFFSSRRRHTRFDCDWSSDVCSSDLKLSMVNWYESGPPVNITAGGFSFNCTPLAYTPQCNPPNFVAAGGFNVNWSGNNYRPSTTPAFNVNKFAFPGAWTIGNAAALYNGLRFPGYYDEDLSLTKKFFFGERFSGELTMQFFNVLNRMLPGACTATDVTDPHFGQNTSPGRPCQGNAPRRGQAEFKIIF